ncbi:MAG: C4-dicarboxylic acid transporter DauA [Gammaproteobacteria bacterium]|nr:C4-dicarboxylic acid transporter DauA [Gammaproteobacteria bacterium]
MFGAIRETIAIPFTSARLRADLLSGLTVGVIALPLSLALAIASGVAPQHGLYTAIIAGIVIALSGGSRLNVSGPTAAFVVILVPITAKFGLGGLLLSGLLAGIILVVMGFARLGTLVQVVPYPVIIGFTSGIGVVLATLQLKDLFGLGVLPAGGDYLDNIGALVHALPHFHWTDLAVGLITLAVLIGWSYRKSRIPGHLIALLAGVAAAWLLSLLDANFTVETLGSRFSYHLGNVTGHGIPPVLPAFVWPWDLPGADGKPIGLSFALFKLLLSSAFAIAILGALESLLCATVADGMAGTRHDPNDELIGQGIGNIVAPFFGGIPATAALARTAANIRSGAVSPLSSVVHGLFIVAAILVLAPWLAWLPMASMAALLLVVAWNMGEARHFVRIVRIAPRSDVLTLLTCFLLTVLLDMEIAVGVGMSLAALLFVRRSIELTGARLIERHEHPHTAALPPSIVLYDINGPLFFGAAQKALSGLTQLRHDIQVVILDMADVPMMDITGLVALESIVVTLQKKHIMLIFSNLAPRIRQKLRNAGIQEHPGVIQFVNSLNDASHVALAQVNAPTT